MKWQWSELNLLMTVGTIVDVRPSARMFDSNDVTGKKRKFERR
jgi:hypothetical protein